MFHPDVPLNPADFVIVPAVYVLDEFDMTDEDGNIVARIDANFIAKTVARMNEREATTGDLCPIVIGHTKDNPQGDEEINGPPVVGYFRNWRQIPFFDTGKTAAAGDAWIMRSEAERVRKFPRRSGEVWVAKHEIDPVSFLGATTPARDLGMLRINLSRTGAFIVPVAVGGNIFDKPERLSREASQPTNRESQAMADENKKADEGQTGAHKELCGKIDQLTAVVQSLVAKIGGEGAAAPAPTGGETGGEGDQPLSDEELAQYLAQMGGEGAEGGEEEDEEEDEEKKKSRKGEEVVKNNAGYAGGNDTFIPNMAKKMSRQDEEIAVLRTKLARNEIKDRLRVAEKQGADVDATDEKLIDTLVVLPEDLREDMIVRLSRNKSKTSATGRASAAIHSTENTGKKRVTTADDQTAVVKLARSKNISYDEAKTQLGFE